MKRYLQHITESADLRTDDILVRQCLDPNHPDYGGIAVSEVYIEPKGTFFRIATAVACYLYPESRHFNSGKLPERLSLALGYLERMQHQDGTYDFLNCNFASAPDTAFMIQEWFPTIQLLKQEPHCELTESLLPRMLSIMEKAAFGIATGGFHTPNHRWAIASVLLAVQAILPNPLFQETAETYLREGIDCNEDGEYAERSAAIYNVVNNDAMLRLYETTGNSLYLDCVRRNLTMMLHYFEPDMSVFTGNSTRQDMGRKLFPSEYITQYLQLAKEDDDRTFEAAAHSLLHHTLMRPADLAPDALDWFLLHPEWMTHPLCNPAMPQHYVRHFEMSGAIRMRDENRTITLLKDQVQFLHIQQGSLVMSVSMGVSWFEHRHFKAQSLEQEKGVTRMIFEAPAWYYQPFKEGSATADWWEMPHEQRNKTYKTPLRIELTFEHDSNGLAMTIQTGGCEKVPLRIELALPADSLIGTQQLWMEGKPGHCLLIKEGMVQIDAGRDTLQIGPAFGSHHFLHGKEGSEPHSAHHQTILFTDSTPINRTLHFR